MDRDKTQFGISKLNRQIKAEREDRERSRVEAVDRRQRWLTVDHDKGQVDVRFASLVIAGSGYDFDAMYDPDDPRTMRDRNAARRKPAVLRVKVARGFLSELDGRMGTAVAEVRMLRQRDGGGRPVDATIGDLVDFNKLVGCEVSMRFYPDRRDGGPIDYDAHESFDLRGEDGERQYEPYGLSADYAKAAAATDVPEERSLQELEYIQSTETTRAMQTFNYLLEFGKDPSFNPDFADQFQRITSWQQQAAVA